MRLRNIQLPSNVRLVISEVLIVTFITLLVFAFWICDAARGSAAAKARQPVALWGMRAPLVGLIEVNITGDDDAVNPTVRDATQIQTFRAISARCVERSGARHL